MKNEFKNKKKGEKTMCEATAYYKDGDTVTILLESVDAVVPEEGGLRITNIFGEQKIVKGHIEALSLTDHKIYIVP